MSHAARWVSDADRDAWQSHQAQRQQVSSAVSQGRGETWRRWWWGKFYCFLTFSSQGKKTDLALSSLLLFLLFFIFLLMFLSLSVSSLVLLTGSVESELAAVGSRRMLFPNCGSIPNSQDIPLPRGPSDVTDLGLGLQSLRLSSWDRPWSSQEADSHSPSSQVQSSSSSSKWQSGVYPRFTASFQSWFSLVFIFQHSGSFLYI